MAAAVGIHTTLSGTAEKTGGEETRTAFTAKEKVRFHFRNEFVSKKLQY